MKKILKYLGFTVLAIVVLAGIGATYISVKGVPNYNYAPTPEIVSLQIPRGDSMRIERGQKIANVVCKECHRGIDGKMSGSMRTDLPQLFGEIASLNITQDPVHGIGEWTDGEIYYFLRTGIRKNGKWAPPFMPKYTNMADEDIKSIIAWLRSDDPTLQPSEKEYPANKYNFMVKFLSNTAFSAPPLAPNPIPLPDTSNQLALGRYLADAVFDCYACHSGDLTKLDINKPSNSFRYYGGGNLMQNLEGEIVPTANLTMHPETGIGKWTEQQFIDAVKYGKKPSGGALAYPMPPHATLTDREVGAIYAYLKTVPVIDHKVERYVPASGK